MSYNQNTSYGRALLNMITSVCPAFGNVHVVLNSSNSDEKNYQQLQDVMKVDGDGYVRFFTSLESAYTACESNNNDVILLDANSSHVVAAGMDWSKNRIHVIGMDGGDRLVQQGAKVQSTDGVGDAYVIKVTGTRNSFVNIKFIQVDTTNTSLTVAQDGGEGTLWKNCSFTFGVSDNLGGATTYEFVAGSDSATYINCTFGSDTLLTSAARSVFRIDQVTSGQEFKSNIMKDCLFNISFSEAGAYLLSVAANTDVLFSNLFIDCNFLASVDSAGGIALTNAITSVSGLVKGCLAFKNPGAFNCTNFSANDSTAVEVQAPAVSNNAFEAVTPA